MVMMKKRKSPAPQDEDSSEMEVDNEEKVEMVEEDSSDEEIEDEATEERNPGEDNSFLDTFYGLSSPDAADRAQAANTLLHHCLLGPDANVKDAAYAFRRLLNGICSGRAAARQGNASALATFLKVAFEGGQLEEIRTQEEEKGGKEKSEDSLLSYVRHRLLDATDPSQTQGKKKSSEERDYQFGRLFGTLSVARSGILLPINKEGADLDDTIHVASGFVSDLVKLFHHKKWMKEPAAHAIGTILNSFYAVSNTKNGKKVVTHLVEEVIIPKLLLDNSGNSSVKEYSAEQIAVAAIIQSQIRYHPKGLPAPLDEPIVSPESIPMIAQTLVATSSVVQPRTHLVWDAILLFLTEEVEQKTSTGKKKKGPRKLRDKLPFGDSSVRDTVESLMRHVVAEGLLKVDASNPGKTTHERRSLAICIVRNLLGVPFNSSISGPTQLLLEAEDLEQMILTPVMIRRLFLDVICAGGGGQKKAHLLKPLALQILEAMVTSIVDESSGEDVTRRLTVAQCLLRSEPRFDGLTKTTTVSDLVGLSADIALDVGPTYRNMWQKYLDFSEEQLISSMQSEEENGGKVLAYTDLLYNAARRLLRLQIGSEAEKHAQEFFDFRSKKAQNILSFFMVSSFFDCSKVSREDASPSKSSKKAKKKEKNQQVTDSLVEAAMRLNRLREKVGGTDKSPLPYDARSVLSERFFGLLHENVNASTHSLGSAQSEKLHAKDSVMLTILSDLCKGWQSLEASGATPLFPAIRGSGEGKEEGPSPDKIVFQLQGLARDLADKGDSGDPRERAKKRCATGCAVLASALFLHLLGCGRPDDIMEEEDITTEDDDDTADIVDAIEEISEIAPVFVEGSVESEDNPLAGFAELCIGVLSNSICSGSPGRGASPKLLREAVKLAWMGILAASATSDRVLLDSDVISVLLNGIGAIDGDLEENEQADVEEDESENDEDDSSTEGLDGDFSKLGNILVGEDDEAPDEVMAEGDKDKAEEGEQDVEIDSEKLNSLLEEDSDADVETGELEHHEGADAALAMLIKVKQEARKASRQARERLELAKQIRCTVLIESLFLGKTDSWSSLFRSDILLQLMKPMLAYRNQLEKNLSRTSGKVNTTDGSTEKRALLDRLTSILKQKVFKVKLAGMQISASTDIVELSCSLASELMSMAKKTSSKEQMTCYSGGLNMILKAISDSEGISRAASVYSDAVREWSTKRASKFEMQLFDDLINHSPRYVLLYRQ